VGAGASSRHAPRARAHHALSPPDPCPPPFPPSPRLRRAPPPSSPSSPSSTSPPPCPFSRRLRRSLGPRRGWLVRACERAGRAAWACERSWEGSWGLRAGRACTESRARALHEMSVVPSTRKVVPTSASAPQARPASRPRAPAGPVPSRQKAGLREKRPVAGDAGCVKNAQWSGTHQEWDGGSFLLACNPAPLGPLFQMPPAPLAKCPLPHSTGPPNAPFPTPLARAGKHHRCLDAVRPPASLRSRACDRPSALRSRACDRPSARNDQRLRHSSVASLLWITLRDNRVD
jgi:hypothetical protein